MDALGNPRRTNQTARKSTGGCIARLKREPQLQEVERQLATTTMEPATLFSDLPAELIEHIVVQIQLPDGLRFVSGSNDTTCIVYHGLALQSGARGMKQRVDAIKEALSVEAGLPLPAAIKAANELMGIDGAGPLPEQVRRLVEELGLEY